METWKIFYWLACAAVITLCIFLFETKRKRAATSFAVLAVFLIAFSFFEWIEFMTHS